MNEDRYQQFRRAQVTNNRLFVRMLLCVAALSVVLVILDASTDTATGLARLAEILIGVATILCMVVVIVTMGLFLVVLNVDTYVRPRDRSLPSWGGWARLTKRVAIRVLLFTWLLVPFALIPLDTVGFFALDFGENALYDWAIDPIRFVTGTVFLVGFLAALVWLIAEGVAGFREERAPRRTTPRADLLA